MVFMINGSIHKVDIKLPFLFMVLFFLFVFANTNGKTLNSTKEIELTFSHERDLFDHSFELLIASNYAEAEIIYTIDCSTPTRENGIKYEKGIYIDSTIVVKAIALSINYTSKVIENWNNNQYSVKIPEYKRKVEHSVQLYIKNDKLEFGEKYRVSFELNTDKPGQISINYILGRHPYTCYAKAKLEIKPNKKKYECIIAPLKVKGEHYLPRTLRFFLGNIQKNTISIKNIKLVTINQPPKK